jgi:non-haem Fe2+, alpha-ketoglutarate-dependent halogenase
VTARLTRQQIEQYERDGVVFPVRVFSAGEAARFRGALDALSDKCGEGALKRFDNLHLFFDWAYQLVTHDALLDAVEGVLGGDLLVEATVVFYKPPQDVSYVSWHQDSLYSGWHLTPSTSAWIALTPSVRANGCVRVVPGSHKRGLLEHQTIRDDPNLLNRRGERVEMTVDEAEALDLVLRPGEMSLHHSNIVHGSNPNSSDEPRVGFIVRFVTNRTTNSARPMLRVRGRADCGHLTLARPPADTDPHTAFNAWRAFKLPKLSDE